MLVVCKKVVVFMCLDPLQLLQAVTILKAEEKGTSGSLLAKLHYGVVQFLEEASLLLRTSAADWTDVSDKLRVS